VAERLALSLTKRVEAGGKEDFFSTWMINGDFLPDHHFSPLTFHSSL
jgi:hypothetical protein